MRRLLLLVVVISTLGCATRWTRTGFTEQDFKRDSYECERDASTYPGMHPQLEVVSLLFSGQTSAGHFFARCMEARGYSRVK